MAANLYVQSPRWAVWQNDAESFGGLFVVFLASTRAEALAVRARYQVNHPRRSPRCWFVRPVSA